MDFKAVKSVDANVSNEPQRNWDEDDRRFAYRCMMQAHRMLRPTAPKRGMSGRR
ncbi:hypothetical protein [Porphyromonas loveana]|uniref:Uncharacterized protein n=1 Tax=Porphyromonas loveana TaxID=1884669 RepID=A0A2U1FAH1_9PORP|nr:hypothetical protein [Porphyromonas loveana]PVZ09164.1 hypothetical protein C7382_11031 [Porphyromonas loveana]